MKLEEIRKITAQISKLQSADQEKNVRELLQSLGYEPGSLYQELEMTSAYVDTHRDASFSGSPVNLHSHAFFEVICVRTSGGAEYLVEAQRYKLQRGDIVIVPPGISHRPLLPEQMTEAYRRDVLWISQELLDNLMGMFPGDQIYNPTKLRLLRTAGTKWEFLMESFQQGVREAEEKRPGWEVAVVANTIQILNNLRRALLEKSSKPLKAEKKELMDKVLEYIEKNYHQKLMLSDVAHHFYVSESSITQLFRKKVGISFYRWVTQRRLIAAKSLIEEGKMLEDVAQLVGFADYSSFYRAFKQEYGISPRQYRKI